MRGQPTTPRGDATCVVAVGVEVDAVLLDRRTPAGARSRSRRARRTLSASKRHQRQVGAVAGVGRRSLTAPPRCAGCARRTRRATAIGRADQQRDAAASTPSASPFSTRVISTFCASAGTHRCHGASPPWLNSVDQRQQRHAEHDHGGAGLRLLEAAAADRDRHQHAPTAPPRTAAARPGTAAASREPNWNIAASVSLRSSHCAGQEAQAAAAPRSACRRCATAPHLPSTSASARRRVHQQRLERAALALAGGGVERGVERAVQHRHHHEERQHAGELRGARVCGLGEVALLDVASAPAAPATTPRSASAQRRAARWLKPREQARDARRALGLRRAGWRCRTTISTSGASPRAQRGLEVRRHDEHRRRRAGCRAAAARSRPAPRCTRVGLALEEVAQRRRVRRCPATTTSRCSARASSRRPAPTARPAPAGPISTDDSSTVSSVRRSRSASTQLLAEDDPARVASGHAPSRAVAGACALGAERQLDEGLLEVASRRSAPSSSATLPSATVRPCATTTTLVAQPLDLLHDVASRTRCTCAALGVAQPAQRVAQRARGQHVEAVGRLVEHDVRRVVHQRARQRGLHALALAEAVGAAVEQRLHVEQLRQRLGARRRRRRAPCRAGGRSRRCSRARSAAGTGRARRDSTPMRASAARGARATSMPSTATRPASGAISAGEHAQRRRLAGAVGPEQAGDAAVGGA